MQKYFSLLLLQLLLPFIVFSQINFSTNSLEDVYDVAKESNKIVFVYCYSNLCVSCSWLELQAFNDTGLSAFFNNSFVNYSINIDEPENAAFVKKYSLKKYPTLLFLSPDKKLIHAIEGAMDTEQLIERAQLVRNAYEQPELQIEQRDSLPAINFYDVDGRYTLGARGQRLMYGYPYPSSTSHFVVQINEKFASNTPRFQSNRTMRLTERPYYGNSFRKKLKSLIRQLIIRKKGSYFIKNYNSVAFLSDTLRIQFPALFSMQNQIKYTFEGIDINQKLIPLNERFEPTTGRDTALYYRIEYTFKNRTDADANIGLLTLFDTMIDDNDAAQMDVFEQAELKDGQRISLNVKRMRGKQVKYTGKDVPNRVLVYRNTTRRTSDFTGDFHLIDKPDELYIGAWPLLYGVLWDVNERRLSGKYYDSAVLMKWLPQKLAPGKKRTIYFYYGLYNKGILEIIPAGTTFTGTDKDGNRIIHDSPQFDVQPRVIREGEEVVVSWKTLNPLNADVQISPLRQRNIPNIDSVMHKPPKTTTYNFTMKHEGKILADISRQVIVLPPLKYETGSGKIMLGTSQGDLTFGNQKQYSETHFVLRYGDSTYTNQPGIKDFTTITGRRSLNEGDSIKHTFVFERDSFILKQHLRPLMSGNSTSNYQNAWYFEMVYTLINKGRTPKTVQLRHLVDLANDNALTFRVDTTDLTGHQQIQLAAYDLPKNIYLKDTLNHEITEISIPQQKLLPQINISQWPDIYSHKDKITKKRYTSDMGIALNWQSTSLSKGDSIRFAYQIGTGNRLLKLNYDQSELIDTLSLFFDTNDTILTPHSRRGMIDLFKDNRRKYNLVLIEGHTDNVGSIAKNYDLSNRRVTTVHEFLRDKLKINAKNYLLKTYGEYYASSEKPTEQKDQKHRRVVISLYKVPETNK